MDAAALAAAGLLPPAPGQKIWIPVDVKIHWFSFLSVPDLARASRVCKSWTSLVQKTADCELAKTIGANMPQLARPAKLRFLDRLHHAYLPENMAYLMTWAAGCRGAYLRSGALCEGTGLRRTLDSSVR
jgi:hypothetical protein